MRQQRTLWKEEDCCLMSLQSRCQQHHHEQDGEPIDHAKWNAGARVPVPMTSSVRSVCSALLRNLHGRRSVSHRMPSHDDASHEHGSAFFLPSPVRSCSFCLVHVVIACIWDGRGTICAGCFAYQWASICHHCGYDDGMWWLRFRRPRMRFKT